MRKVLHANRLKSRLNEICGFCVNCWSDCHHTECCKEEGPSHLKIYLLRMLKPTSSEKEGSSREDSSRCPLVLEEGRLHRLRSCVHSDQAQFPPGRSGEIQPDAARRQPPLRASQVSRSSSEASRLTNNIFPYRESLIHNPNSLVVNLEHLQCLRSRSPFFSPLFPRRLPPLDQSKATYVTLLCRNCRNVRTVPCRPGLGGASFLDLADHVAQDVSKRGAP
ncbi:hypothetical protein Cgig2_016878 [Carnegiea gigantea]|uniref:Uncharacterized protein n=1 Tax=Carnegiea gigantea TaxID=171969 RepID=A0A9Q1K5D5_9CARY|nr:hypothetical protein Cgig2_016878 [Carnegiea gigantea]